MISATEREALALLAELCELAPDIRLGQLVAHLGYVGEIETGRTLWDIENEQLVEIMYQHRSELAARLLPPKAVPSDRAPTALENPATASSPPSETHR